MPAPNDRPWCRSRGGADLSRNRRCSCPFPKLQGGRCGVWMTPSRYQSGESDRTGGISRCGDEMMRAMLYEAAQILLVRSAKWSWLKAWAMKIARHRGLKKAIVALARRLAVIMHRIGVDGTEFRWTREVAAT